MIHQPASSYYDGQAGECMMESVEILNLRDSITRVYAQRTGKPIWVISEDMERDTFMSAEEALIYGIVDLVTADNEPNTDLFADNEPQIDLFVDNKPSIDIRLIAENN
jgi:ATP-dependent Clp protease protease subunit